MAIKHSYEYVKNYIENFGYILLSKEYIDNKTPLLLKCKQGHIFKISFNHFQQYKIERYPYCNGSKFTYEYVKNYIENFGYILLSEEYIDANKKIKIMCNKGHVYEATFSQFKHQNQRCPYCSGNAKLTYEYVKDYIESFGYTLLSKEYINSNTHLLVRCECGHEYFVTFSNFKRGRRCNECNKIKWNKEKIIEYIINQTKFEFVEFVKYKKSLSIIKLKCFYGHEFICKFNKIKYGKTGCPICKESKGERKIENFLTKYNIIYKKQYRNEKCKNKNTLPFDFYLTNLNAMIEFDGIQHFEAVEYFGGYEKLLETRFNDEIKNQYCKDNDIKLIRIPYYNYDKIEDILEKELKVK